ncbi:MAG TPA: hypothetical protein PLM63_03960 [bacterium]|nr:hypothetical protein [bacterium]
MKEYIDYLMTKIKTDIEHFTIFSDGSIRIGMNPIKDTLVKLALVSEVIKEIVVIDINKYEVEIEDFDSETPSILFKVKNESH